MITPPANEPVDWSKTVIGLRLDMVKQCRAIFGVKAAAELWAILELPAIKAEDEN